MRIVTATRAFFASLFNREASLRISQALDSKTKLLQQSNDLPRASASASIASTPTSAKASNTSPTRSEALTLLSTLQREARLVDLIQEPLDEYTDEQVGAAARDVLRESSKVLNRLFAIQRLAQGNEGDVVEVPADASSTQWKIVGKAPNKGTGDSTTPRRGNLLHSGWIATQVSIPNWSGKVDEASVIAPAEAELL